MQDDFARVETSPGGTPVQELVEDPVSSNEARGGAAAGGGGGGSNTAAVAGGVLGSLVGIAALAAAAVACLWRRRRRRQDEQGGEFGSWHGQAGTMPHGQYSGYPGPPGAVCFYVSVLSASKACCFGRLAPPEVPGNAHARLCVLQLVCTIAFAASH